MKITLIRIPLEVARYISPSGELDDELAEALENLNAQIVVDQDPVILTLEDCDILASATEFWFGRAEGMRPPRASGEQPYKALLAFDSLRNQARGG